MHTTLIALLLLLQAAQAPEAGQNSGKRRTAVAPLPSETPAEYWDRAYSDPSLVFNTAPNVFLTEVVKGLKPGRALDIGMGQGRNSVYLAKLGWDVTGFDISERGMELARKSAAAAGVQITTIRASMEGPEAGWLPRCGGLLPASPGACRRRLRPQRAAEAVHGPEPPRRTLRRRGGRTGLVEAGPRGADVRAQAGLVSQLADSAYTDRHGGAVHRLTDNQNRSSVPP